MRSELSPLGLKELREVSKGCTTSPHSNFYTLRSCWPSNALLTHYLLCLFFIFGHIRLGGLCSINRHQDKQGLISCSSLLSPSETYPEVINLPPHRVSGATLELQPQPFPQVAASLSSPLPPCLRVSLQDHRSSPRSVSWWCM